MGENSEKILSLRISFNPPYLAISPFQKRFALFHLFPVFIIIGFSRKEERIKDPAKTQKIIPSFPPEKKESGEFHSQLLCLVDENGQFIREEEREKCHMGDGLLHSAFLVMAFNRDHELPLARRSDQKRLWPGFWDGSVASHYFKNERPDITIDKRMVIEIGLTIRNPEYLFNFRYQARYGDIYSENELCDVHRVVDIQSEEITLSRNEISTCRFASIDDIKPEKHSLPGFFLRFKNI